jgi:hypothetical protein
VEVRVPKQQFEELLSASKHGRISSEISVDVEGLEYDWRPDGRGKKWQNKSSGPLLVAYFGERDRRFRRNVTADFGDVTGAGRSVLRVFEL